MSSSRHYWLLANVVEPARDPWHRDRDRPGYGAPGVAAATTRLESTRLRCQEHHISAPILRMSSAYVRRKELSSEAASNQAACDAGAPLSPLGYTARSAGCAPRTSQRRHLVPSPRLRPCSALLAALAHLPASDGREAGVSGDGAGRGRPGGDARGG